jgi:RNA polymerase sigma-70 factor (ECF subfamily)
MSLGLVFPASLLASVAGSRAPGLREDDRREIEAWRNGEREAFDRLVERYQKDVYRICFRYVNDHHDANDMAQEVFLRAYRALAKFRGDSAFATWLYRIAVNTCLSFRTRRPMTEELPEVVPDEREGVAEGLLREERARRVRRAIQELPDKQRATLILKMYHELSHEEVAGILGTSVGTAKANLFHALAKLRRRLGKEGGE